MMYLLRQNTVDLLSKAVDLPGAGHRRTPRGCHRASSRRRERWRCARAACVSFRTVGPSVYNPNLSTAYPCTKAYFMWTVYHKISFPR